MRHLFAVLALVSLGFAQSQLSSTPSIEKEIPPAQDTKTVADVQGFPGIPPAPAGKASLIGGTIRDLDPVRDEVTIHAFGGHDMRILFDERTKVYENGQSGSVRDLKEGQRVYAETVPDNSDVFAQTIRVANESAAQGSGQILSYDSARRDLLLKDALFPNPIKLHLDANATIVHKGQPVPPTELRPGMLITAEFFPSGDGRAVAHEVRVLAEPGAVFTFVGEVLHIDLHSRLLVVADSQNNRTYEIACSPVLIPQDLREGMKVTVTATFDGSRYSATGITRNPTAAN